MADFDWSWPTKIERDIIERALTLDFLGETRNLILVGRNGLGKTMIAQNIAHAAVLAGHPSPPYGGGSYRPSPSYQRPAPSYRPSRSSNAGGGEATVAARGTRIHPMRRCSDGTLCACDCDGLGR